MTSTRPKRNVRNATPAPIVEDDATIVRNTLDRIIYTVDVLARFDRTRRDVVAVQRGESNKTMAQVMTEAKWHEHATKAKKDCPLGSTKKKRYYTIEEESDSDQCEDDPNVPSTSAKKTSKPVPEKKVPTPSKAKLAAMKKKEEAARRKAEREAKKLEALNERDEDEREESEEKAETVSSSTNFSDLPTSSSTPTPIAPEIDSNRIIPEIKVEEYVSDEKKPEEQPSNTPVEEPKSSESTLDTPAPETTQEEKTEETIVSGELAVPEEEKMEVDEPMENITSVEPTPHELQPEPEDMELGDTVSISEENTTVNIDEAANAPAQALEKIEMILEGETPKSPEKEKEEIDEPPVLEKMTSPQNVQEDIPDENRVIVQDSAPVVTEEMLLEEEVKDEKQSEQTQQPLPEDISTSEIPIGQTPEEPMDQSTEILKNETTDTSTRWEPEVTSNQTLDEMKEVSETHQEEVREIENSGTPAIKASEKPETQAQEEPMNQASEILQNITAETVARLEPEVTSDEAACKIREVSGTHREEVPEVENPGTSAEEPKTQSPNVQADQVTDEPMGLVEEEKPIQTPPLPETQAADASPVQSVEQEKPISDSPMLVKEVKEAVKPEPIASTSQVNLDEIELPKEPPPKAPCPPPSIPDGFRPWIKPGSTVDIVNYENPEDSKYTPAERALKPWLGNDVPLYPLNLLPAIDKVPGRVWCPPRRYCRQTQQNVVAIGPLTELETLDTSLTHEAMFLVEPDKLDLIVKRICEIQITKLRRKLLEPRLPITTRVDFGNQLRDFEENYRRVTRKGEEFRYRLARSSEAGIFYIPRRSFTLMYSVFDHMWYTTNRRWYNNSEENPDQLTKKKLKDQKRFVEKNISKFEREIRENAKKHEDLSAEEKIRSFRLPVIHDLRQRPPQIKQRMKFFRQKMALHFRYEDFEKCYLTDPGCREILKKLRPIPFDNGVTLNEAEYELAALIGSYRRRFAREHPVIQLYKAGNEKAPVKMDIENHAKQCLEDVIDTVVYRELMDLPTFPHRIPAHNNAIPKLPAHHNQPIREGFPLDYYGLY